LDWQRVDVCDDRDDNSAASLQSQAGEADTHEVCAILHVDDAAPVSSLARMLFFSKHAPEGAMGVDQGLIKPYAPALVEFNRVIDAIWLAVCLWVACRMEEVPWTAAHTLLALLAMLIFWIVASHFRLYRSWRISPAHSEIIRFWLCWGFTALVVTFVVYALALFGSSGRELLLLWVGLGFCTLTASRLAVRTALRWLRLRGRNFRTAAVAGATVLGQRIAHNITHTSWMGLRVVGFFDDRNAARTGIGVPIRGNFSDLAAMARNGEIDVVYVALPLRSEMRIKSLLQMLRETSASVYFVPDFSGFDLLGAHWDSLGDLPMVSIVGSRVHGMNWVAKRSFDIGFSLAVLLVMAIPMIAIAIAVKLSSPGRIMYRQDRYGLDGRKFEIWKFRTMTVEESTNQFSQARRNDPRVTSIGRFLRKTSLDELPQFINVLQGRMSVVGPRPHPVALTEAQRSLVAGYMWRHKVKPGITGWAQVNGYRGETDTMEKIERRIALDMEYINNWSVMLDCKIIMMTFRTILVAENAY
jgi:putative colanic acid biosynthesis UDP-glucose lipid carrier transferase